MWYDLTTLAGGRRLEYAMPPKDKTPETVPDNHISAPAALAIIDALAGPVTQSSKTDLVVELLPVAVMERLEKCVRDKQLKSVTVSSSTAFKPR